MSHNICTRCDGRGYTRDEAPKFEDEGQGAKPRYVTVDPGKRCWKCGGTGKMQKCA